MSLRARIVLVMSLVLLLAMGLGALVAGYEVRRVLAEELAAALGGARQTAASAFEDLPQSDHPDRDLRQLVATFDGNRHVRAILMRGAVPGQRSSPGPEAPGPIVARSQTRDPGPPPPRWFVRLVEVMPDAIALPVPPTRFGPATLVLVPTPGLDVRAAWNELLALMGVLAATTLAGVLLVYVVIAAALRPLTVLAERFRQIGAGDYSGRVAERGPPELLHLQRGFNLMAGELAGTIARNRMLAEQLSRLQEEERAEIARDLHDEIGPHLFAAALDAEMIAQLAAAGQTAAIGSRVHEIQGAIRYMQGHVRDLLVRLRPTQVTEFGLGAAIEDLVRAWTLRRPEVAFALDLADGRVSGATAEIAYRVVQEGVNNALRHSRPASVRIAIARREDDRGPGVLAISVENDGALALPAVPGSGLGLVGMRERVRAGGGSLTYGPDAAGWSVHARLQLASTDGLDEGGGH